MGERTEIDPGDKPQPVRNRESQRGRPERNLSELSFAYSGAPNCAGGDVFRSTPAQGNQRRGVPGS